MDTALFLLLLRMVWSSSMKRLWLPLAFPLPLTGTTCSGLPGWVFLCWGAGLGGSEVDREGDTLDFPGPGESNPPWVGVEEGVGGGRSEEHTSELQSH